MKWNIVVDSSSDMCAKDIESEKAAFSVVPLKIIVGEQEFVDDDTVDTAALLHAMKNEKRGASSACPSVGDFQEAFLKGDQTICILLTGGLSGTYNSAAVAKDMVLAEHPEKKIHLIDTKATAGVIELVAKKAMELIEKDMSFEALTKTLDLYTKSLNLIFILSNFDNLIKNGRMNPLAGILASHLGIRAVSVNTSEGTIEVKKKCRGEDKAVKTMVKMIMEKKGVKESPIQISHCDNENGAMTVKRLLAENGVLANISIRPCKGLTTFYSMNGGILVSY